MARHRLAEQLAMRLQDAQRALVTHSLEQARRLHQVGEQQRDRGRRHRLRSYYLGWAPGKRYILSGLPQPTAQTAEVDAEPLSTTITATARLTRANPYSSRQTVAREVGLLAQVSSSSSAFAS